MPVVQNYILFRYQILSYALCFIADFICEDFYTKPGNFCHPNTNMSSTTLHEAMQECHDDTSCNAFYKVCSYERYRKCNDTAYEENSECGLVGDPSSLHIKSI